MALQFIDGFDHYFLTNDDGFQGGAAATGQKWDGNFFNGEMYPGTDKGRFGGSALRIRSSAGSASISKNIITPRDEFIVGFAYKPESVSVYTTEIAFTMSSGNKTTLKLRPSTGMVVVDTQFTANAVSSAAGVITTNVWHYIEFRIKEHSTLGEVEVKVNEVTVATLTGINTGADGGLMTLLTIASTNNLQIDHIDDLYLLDRTGADNNNFLGGCRIDTLHTVGNGGTNDFTLFEDGEQPEYDILSNFSAVRNEGLTTIGRDHNYVESGIVGASEDYNNNTFTQLGNIFGVQVVNNSRSTSTGELTYKDEMVIAGTAYDNGSPVIAVNGDYHMSTFIRDTDPSDDASWTTEKVNAVGSGFTIVTREI